MECIVRHCCYDCLCSHDWSILCTRTSLVDVIHENKNSNNKKKRKCKSRIMSEMIEWIAPTITNLGKMHQKTAWNRIALNSILYQSFVGSPRKKFTSVMCWQSFVMALNFVRSIHIMHIACSYSWNKSWNNHIIQTLRWRRYQWKLHFLWMRRQRAWAEEKDNNRFESAFRTLLPTIQKNWKMPKINKNLMVGDSFWWTLWFIANTHRAR